MWVFTEEEKPKKYGSYKVAITTPEDFLDEESAFYPIIEYWSYSPDKKVWELEGEEMYTPPLWWKGGSKWGK